jgi:hypothetical protein
MLARWALAAVGRTILKRTKDTPILIKEKNINQVIAHSRRESFENWLAALGRAKKLRLRGYDVKLPPPQLGRPQFLLINNDGVVILDKIAAAIERTLDRK